MLRESSVPFLSLSEKQAQELVSEISKGRVPRFPIRRCMKFFARLTEENELTYAREPRDLGTKTITSLDISSRMSEDRRTEAASALAAFEEVFIHDWPFLPGSQSWLEIEVTENRVTVLRAVRLTSLGRENITTTGLVEKIASRVKLGPTTTGSGWTVSFIDIPAVKSREISSESLNDILKMLVEENHDCENGFYMYTQFGKIRITKEMSVEDVNSFPAPAIPVGVIK